MEYGSRLRFALLAIGGILLLVLSIWGVTSIARHLFGGTSAPKTSLVKKTDLADYDTSSSYIRVTVDGPIIADEDHVSYQIEVGQNYRDMKIFSGYDKKLVDEVRYSNNSTAYINLLKALKLTSFTAKNPAYGNDEVGYCATGNRHIYELIDHSKDVIRSWNTSCDASIGTFAGAGPSVRYLLQKQIPDFQKLTRDLQL